MILVGCNGPCEYRFTDYTCLRLQLDWRREALNARERHAEDYGKSLTGLWFKGSFKRLRNDRNDSARLGRLTLALGGGHPSTEEPGHDHGKRGIEHHLNAKCGNHFT